MYHQVVLIESLEFSNLRHADIIMMFSQLSGDDVCTPASGWFVVLVVQVGQDAQAA